MISNGDDPRSSTPERLSELLDGRLSDDEARETLSQVTADPELNASFDALKETRDLIRTSHGMATLPAGFDARLRMRIKAADLQERAEERIAKEDSRSFVTRGVLALGAFAAGAAIMLALDSSNIFVSDDAGIDYSAGVDINSANDVTLTSSDVKPLVNNHLNKVAKLTQQVAIANSVDPQWLAQEFEISELKTSNADLLTLVQKVRDVEAQDMLRSLTELQNALSELDGMVRSAESDKKTIGKSQIVKLLQVALSQGQGRKLIVEIHPVNNDASNSSDDLSEQHIRLANDPTYKRLLRGLDCYRDEDYRKAWNSLRRVLEQSSDSPYFVTALYSGAMSLVKLGDGANAHQLVDTVAIHAPNALIRFSEDELKLLDQAASENEPTQWAQWQKNRYGTLNLIFSNIPQRRTRAETGKTALSLVEQRQKVEKKLQEDAKTNKPDTDSGN